MQAPLLVRPLMDAERNAVEMGLSSSDAFTLRRSQILAASARRAHPPDCPQPQLRRAGRRRAD